MKDKWTIINEERDNHITWVIKFPKNTKLASVFSGIIRGFVHAINIGAFGDDNTVAGIVEDVVDDSEDDTRLSGKLIRCPKCKAPMQIVPITAYDIRFECSQCDYFIVRDAF